MPGSSSCPRLDRDVGVLGLTELSEAPSQIWKWGPIHRGPGTEGQGRGLLCRHISPPFPQLQPRAALATGCSGSRKVTCVPGHPGLKGNPVDVSFKFKYLLCAGVEADLPSGVFGY